MQVSEIAGRNKGFSNNGPSGRERDRAPFTSRRSRSARLGPLSVCRAVTTGPTPSDPRRFAHNSHPGMVYAPDACRIKTRP